MKKIKIIFFIIFLFGIFTFHLAHAQNTYIPDADAVKETRPISFYQELLLRRMKHNEVENEIERGRLNLEALRLTRKLLLQQSEYELAEAAEKKIHRLQERLSYLERKKDELEDKIYHQLFPKGPRSDVAWNSYKATLFSLPRWLLVLKAQIDITLTQEYDPTKASLEELAKIKELWSIYDKAGDIRIKMESLSGLLDLADLTQSSAGEINQKKINDLINEAQALLKRGMELIKELRNKKVKELKGKLERLKELVDLDGEIPQDRSSVGGEEVVPSALLDETVKEPIAWLELEKGEYYSGASVTGTIWLKNGQAPYAIKGAGSIGYEEYTPESIVKWSGEIAKAPELAQDESEKRCMVYVTAGDAKGKRFDSNTVEFTVIPAKKETVQKAPVKVEAPTPAPEPSLPLRWQAQGEVSGPLSGKGTIVITADGTQQSFTAVINLQWLTVDNESAGFSNTFSGIYIPSGMTGSLEAAFAWQGFTMGGEGTTEGDITMYATVSRDGVQGTLDNRWAWLGTHRYIFKTGALIGMSK